MKKLKEMCKSLKDYSEYTARVREYAQVKPVEEAVEQAISECIQEGILSEFLKQNRAEAKQVSIYEYDEEKHMRQEREASWEEGREEGIEEGIKKGKQELLERLIQKKLVKGKSISEIAEELEEEEEVIAEMIQKSVRARKWLHFWLVIRMDSESDVKIFIEDHVSGNKEFYGRFLFLHSI